MANSDCIVLQGGNMAEAHPVGFQWVAEAKARGATVIHIDPRFTRTSAVADRHIPIRAGSDIVLLGALINHVITHDLWFHEYVIAYTNAATIVTEDFADTDDLDGLFSGFDPESGTYDSDTWEYAQAGGGEVEDAGGEKGEQSSTEGDHGPGDQLGSGGAPLENAQVERDETLQHPRTVFQLLRRHYSRYTPAMVQEMCGIDAETFAALAETITSSSGRDRTTMWGYATGWTQHTSGAQFIRAAAVLQLLLGNVGRPGGGIMALRGHASIQGSTDIPTLFNLLPGYLPMPVAGLHDTLADYLDVISGPGQKGFWGNADAYTVSLLKAYFGEHASAENDWCFDHLPRLTGPHGTYQTMMEMLDGGVEGYFVVGQNPAVGSANSRAQRLALAQLKWLVVRDLSLIETATWWKDSPEVASGELRTEDIETEVFFLPAATHVEKAGSFTQTQRLLQWRHKALDAPGDCQSELDFYYHLGVRIRELLAGSADERDRPLLEMTWDYALDEHGDPEPESVLKEINGYEVVPASGEGGDRTAGEGPGEAGDEGGGPAESDAREGVGRALSGYAELAADGSTACGCWIYSGVYAEETNQAARRTPHGGDGPAQAKWGWAWPADRRILYNRASADPDGRPWSERKKWVWWDEEAGRWTGSDVPDFPAELHPHHRPEPGTGGVDGLAGDDPFVMQSDGKGWLYAPKGLVDGPFPTHYEAAESPVRNALYTQQQNPTRMLYPHGYNLDAPSAGEAGVEVYPYVFTTYRLTEHHTAGGMSRWLPYLSELQPEMFCEVSPALAAERGLTHNDWATIVSPRAVIEARVMVTDRMRPLRVDGREVHQVGLPYHWGVGEEAIVTGDAANDLLGVSLDANTQIQESKVASCDVRPGRRPRGAAAEELVADYNRRAGVTPQTGNQRLTDPEQEGRG